MNNKIAVLVLSEKKVYKEKNGVILKKCFILSEKSDPIYIKSKKKFSSYNSYIKIVTDKNNKILDVIDLGKVSDENNDRKIFYHIFTKDWISNKILSKSINNFMKISSENIILYDNSLDKRLIFSDKVITVDPIGATDLDDGFTFNNYDEYYDLVIHIANPTSYFNTDQEIFNIIFDEIYKRLSTCYIEESCHLFPEIFVNHVSFLKKNINDDKRSISFFFKINKQNNNVEFDFKFLTLKNILNTTYEDFQIKCDKNQEYYNDLLSLSIKLIDIMGLNYKKELLHYDFSHKIIEIFMLWTNYYIGNFMKNNIGSLIVRTQEQFCPTEQLFNAPNYTTNFLNFSANYKIINKKSYGINNSKILSLENQNYSHFSLGIINYAHVTSPMRRFVDFVNHLLLSEFKNNNGNTNNSQNILSKIDDNYINQKLKIQKKISHSYQILKHIKENSNKFRACILDFNSYLDKINALIVVHNEQYDFKKIISVNLPINHNIKLEKFSEFDVELYYNSVNFKSHKFPFDIKIINNLNNEV